MLKLVRHETNIPLWQVNHSREDLLDKKREDFASFQLGYYMKDEFRDPSKACYKYFKESWWPEGNLTDLGYDPLFGPVHLMADFNRTPMCWALGHYIESERQYLVFDEIVGREVLTREQCSRLKEHLDRYGIRHIHLWGDNTSNQGGSHYGRTGKNDWTIIREYLQANGITFTSHLGVSNPPRKDRSDKVNNVIGKDAEQGPTDLEMERRLLINKDCKWVREDFLYTLADASGAPDTSQGDREHMTTAIGYWIWGKEQSGGSLRYVL